MIIIICNNNYIHLVVLAKRGISAALLANLQATIQDLQCNFTGGNMLS